MRVWTIHPRYLDRKELRLSWSSGLKALKVLSQPKIYNRFQSGLSVFRTQSEPLFALTSYLLEIAKEGKRRGMDMDVSNLPKLPKDFRLKIPVSVQRVRSDRQLLIKHLARIGKKHVEKFESMRASLTHPLFFLHTDDKPGAWELISKISLKH